MPHRYCSIILRKIFKQFGHRLSLCGGGWNGQGICQKLNAQIAIIDKRRDRPNSSEVMHIVGNVKGCTVVL